MKAFFLLCLVGLAAAAPTSKEDDDLVIIDSDFYPKEWIKYTSQHDIVNILVPLNSLNFDEDDSSESDSKEDDNSAIVFFAEADLLDNDKKAYKGVSVMKKGKVTKLLDNAIDMAASGDDSKLVFLAASDGIYVYHDEKTAVEKYGSINDDVIGIAKEKSGEVIYILTASHEVFKVTDNGNKKEKMEDIVNAKQIMLDYSNNLYFYSTDKQPYVRTSEGVKKINGLPEHPKYAQLVKPAFVMDDMVPFVVDETTYLIYANGTSEKAGIDFKKSKYRPTAYSMEGTIVQYYAHDKNLYEYNMLAILLGSMMEEMGNELRSLLQDNKNTMEQIKAKPRTMLRSHM